MDACPAASNDETVGERTDVLLEWLCLHLEEEELPEGFDPRGRNLDVIRPGQNFGASVGGNPDANKAGTMSAAGRGISDGRSSGVASASVQADDSLEGRLLGYGFGHAEVAGTISASTSALAGLVGESGGDVSNKGEKGIAVDWGALVGPLEAIAKNLATSAGGASKRYRGGGGGVDGGSVEDTQTEQEGREATEEEVMSLEAIYDGAVTVTANMPEVLYLRDSCDRDRLDCVDSLSLSPRVRLINW